MNRRYTISGIEHLIRLLSVHPELMSLASLAPLTFIAEKARAASKACGCNANEVYNENKGQFELALNNLSHGDHLVVKRVLNVDSLCYYVRDNTGKLVIRCI